MKKWLPLLLAVISFSSCSRYQYATLSSDIPKDKKDEFVAESDTLRITYNFNGKKGPVNWQINGSISTSAQTLSTSSSLIMADITGQEGLEFLPPHSFISRTGMFIRKSNEFFNLPGDVVKEKIKMMGIAKKTVKGSFKKENSPFVFRSYLTFIQTSSSKSSENMFSVDNTFYVSQLLETMAGPDLIWPDPRKPGNTFFLNEL